MSIYLVNHTGGCRGLDGQIYRFEVNKRVELPDDVAGALGPNARLIERSQPVVAKVVAAPPIDKMVRSPRTTKK
jgi:hypothetical protein